MSREQAGLGTETQGKDGLEGDALKVALEERVKITFYDNISLKKTGEYIIRGQVHTTVEGDGFIKPIYFPDTDLIVVSCLVT